MLDRNVQQKLIQSGRDFMKGYREGNSNLEGFESDQDLKLPQPPLTKAPMASEREKISLPLCFDKLEMNHDYLQLLTLRKSSRVYDQKPVSLLQLSFLLWSTQGIKKLRGKAYATLRTVPSGGARHAFETYLMVRNVEDLEQGIYHYLPMEHALERIGHEENLDHAIGQALCGQNWAAKSGVVFFWSVVAYRAEWRYGITAHRVALMDAGHVGQNLYMSCAALGLGTCAIGAFDHKTCCELFQLDGEEEFPVYAAPVGAIRPSDQAKEQAFYRFVEEEGL